MAEIAKDHVQIVLHRPQHPGNIGSSIRAMVTMGFKDLALVAPKIYPDPRVSEYAARADKYLNSLEVEATLKSAIASKTLVIGVTARSRELSLPLLTPNDLPQVCQARPNDQIALVFGPERAGLSNEDMALCHYQLTIPTDEQYQSLNLAQAVQVVCYALHAAETESITTEQNPLASQQEVEYFMDLVEDLLTKIEFYDPSNPRKLLPKIRRLLNKSQLENTELNILKGVVATVLRKL